MTDELQSIVSRKSITIPLIEYLELLWQKEVFAGFVNVDETKALLISQLDKDEIFSHVQFPSSKEGVQQARVWRKNMWLMDIEYHTMQKERSEKDAQASFRREEQLIIVLAKLAELTGLDKGDEMILQKARKIVLGKNIAYMKTLGIKVD